MPLFCRIIDEWDNVIRDGDGAKVAVYPTPAARQWMDDSRDCRGDMADFKLRHLEPCVVSHNMALGGAQTAVLRLIQCMPGWVRDATTLYVQSRDVPLLDAAVRKHDFRVGAITTTPPDDPSCWVLSYGDLTGLPQRPTSLILHSWDDEGWRYVTRTYGKMRGLNVAGVSGKVLARYNNWIRQNDHHVAGVLPPPVTEMTVVKGRADKHRLVVGWMGRPLESKGLMSLPWLLKMDKRLVIRAWTGADTAGLPYTRKVQGQAMDKLYALAESLGVLDRLDVRPLDFDPFVCRHRLEGCHVLLGNSRKEGFLLTAAEALSCGIPVVVTDTCGISDYIHEGHNGYLIPWDENPQALAFAALPKLWQAARLDSMTCLQSVQNLTIEGRYKQVYGDTLARLTGTELQHDDARVTIGVRIHKGTRTECLDDAVASIAAQTYRKFKVVLLVDGPWEFGQRLADRFNLPLICTGMEPDITHCSWLHRQAVEQCDTELYKPLDYDDQLHPTYLERAVRMMARHRADVYGCMLMTLENGQIAPRLHWPNKPLDTMFTGNSDHNQLPHSSVLLKADMVRKAGNYQERAVGLGADDYHLWYRLWKSGAKFIRDDKVRNVVYRIHDRNSLNVRRRRYGTGRGALIAGATAASLAIAPLGMADPQPDPRATLNKKKDQSAAVDREENPPRLDPPHS